MTVSELLALKFEHLALRQGQLQLQNQLLIVEGAALMKEMRESVGAGPQDAYDPQTKRFLPASGPHVVSTSKPDEPQSQRRRKSLAQDEVA